MLASWESVCRYMGGQEYPKEKREDVRRRRKAPPPFPSISNLRRGLLVATFAGVDE